MIVCSCNVLSDGQIKACVRSGPGCPRTAADVYQCLGCSPKCGRCARTIRQIVTNALMGVDVPVAITACASECATACSLGMSHDKSPHDHGYSSHDHAETHSHRQPARAEAMSGA